MDCQTAFASLNGETLIDVINPETNLSWCYGKDLAKIREEYPDAEIVNIADWCQAKGERQNTPIIWTETTEEIYWQMLEVLPPAAMCGGAFLVGEPADHHAGNGQPRFDAFRQIGKTYLNANRPMTRAEFKAELEAANPSKNLSIKAGAK